MDCRCEGEGCLDSGCMSGAGEGDGALLGASGGGSAVALAAACRVETATVKLRFHVLFPHRWQVKTERQAAAVNYKRRSDGAPQELNTHSDHSRVTMQRRADLPTTFYCDCMETATQISFLAHSRPQGNVSEST